MPESRHSAGQSLEGASLGRHPGEGRRALDSARGGDFRHPEPGENGISGLTESMNLTSKTVTPREIPLDPPSNS